MCNNNYIKLSIVSPEKIENWSQRLALKKSRNSGLSSIVTFGDVLSEKIENTNNFFATPYDRFGLFSETIFGSCKENFVCSCSFLISSKNKNKTLSVCPYCGVERTKPKVREIKMGSIPLVLPLLHVWFSIGGYNIFDLIFRQNVSNLKDLFYFDFSIKAYSELTLLSKKREKLENIISNLDKEIFYSTNLDIREKKQNELNEIKKIVEKLKGEQKESAITLIERGMIGNCSVLDSNNELNYSLNEKVYNLLRYFNPRTEIDILKNSIFDKIRGKSHSILTKDLKKLRLLENFFNNNKNVSDFLLTRIPVIPAALRPILSGNGLSTSSGSPTNTLYQKIIRQNNRIINLYKNLRLYNTALLTSEIRILQETVDYLIDQSKLRNLQRINNKPLNSLVDLVKGKFGHFRKQILGKRVNFSGRSVIAVNPLLRINQCGIPFDMAKILFEPLIKCITKFYSKHENYSIECTSATWTLLSIILKTKTVFLNRAPTLHKLGIQSFEPILTSKRAIQIHPLVCSAYNADFDGDQMSLHIPILEKAKQESSKLIKSTKEFFSFADGSVKLKMSQDIVLGLVYLTLDNSSKKYYFNSFFNNVDFVLSLLKNKKLWLHDPIWMKTDNELNYFETTPGRLYLNSIIKK